MSKKRLIIKDHNKEAYERVRERLETTNRTCVIHATGTGKAYIALQCIRDNTGHVLYITSMKANLIRFRELVDMYFENKSVDYYIYSNLKNCNSDIKPNLIILDEFHRSGAIEWGSYVLKLLSSNPDAKVLGLTATEIRYLDNERNMAEELFEGDVASSLPLNEAMIRGILPLPDYSVCVYSYVDEVYRMENDIKNKRVVNEEGEASRILKRIKKKLKNSRGLREYFEENITVPNGKYIVFCSNYEHLQEIKKESKKWFGGFKVRYYEMYSASEDAYEQLKRFEDDHSDSLKLLFVISMLNEGVHVNGVNGCILFRLTESPNVYFQQIGRVLSANSYGTPAIMDVANNIQNLKKIREFWEQVDKETKKRGKRKSNDSDGPFRVFGRDIDIINEISSFDALRSRGVRWNIVFEEVKKWYEENQNSGDALQIPSKIYAHYGDCLWNLGNWLSQQRTLFRKNKLDKEKIEKLNSIGMQWEVQKPIKYTWTQKEDDIVQKYYRQDRTMVSQLLLNKTPAAVTSRAKYLGIYLNDETEERKCIEEYCQKFEKAWVIDDEKYSEIEKKVQQRNPNYMMWKIAERAYRGKRSGEDYEIIKKIIFMKYRAERTKEIVISEVYK